jgi:hypothetical protein
MLKKSTHHADDEDPSSSFVKRRRVLTSDISTLRDPQRIYMPGIKPLLDTIDPVLLTNRPEDADLWLPSTLPPTSWSTQCIDGLPRIEYRLRFAQAMNALEQIRLCCRLLRLLSAKTQVHITNTQKTGTRTRSVFDKANAKRAQAVATYRAARKAIECLASNKDFGPWKHTLLKLEDSDVHGPGREASETLSSCFIQSWIWTTAMQTLTSDEDPDLNATLRVEWCKAQERAKRYEEEVALVVEEMWWTLATFGLNAREWDERAISLPSNAPTLSSMTVAGAVAYAHKQADVQ